MKLLLVAGFLAVILYNLSAGLYYMLVDKGASKRTVNALTRRIGFSIALIALVIVGIATGVVQPHGVGV
ncbi:twin transmembrane helix small protein [Lysobacter sp. K5869]|uniref:twin transmembrane helix small protein n=1 Tax=Lysobacter sp. K5869 TaxID=2820808 RepID=UPI001C060709|nr:twin transmembrane helix small protein [Lysobacter sp. K5869]QWP78076.1 twin transmembrane helix small protein [Lysobacter sp. K5869]